MSGDNEEKGEQHHVGEGHCTDCGHAHVIERSYKVTDRSIEWLIVAVAQSLGLRAYRKGRKQSSTIYIAGSDSSALDRCEARVVELTPALDAELMKVMLDYVKKHTGVELKVSA